MTIVFKGWTCACGIFNGEEKSPRDTCRTCDAPKPLRCVHKFHVPRRVTFTLDLDPDGKILSVEEQHGHIQMWVLVDPDRKPERRFFAWLATGERFDTRGTTHVKTMQFDGGMLVFHLFEIAPAVAREHEQRIRERDAEPDDLLIAVKPE